MRPCRVVILVYSEWPNIYDFLRSTTPPVQPSTPQLPQKFPEAPKEASAST